VTATRRLAAILAADVVGYSRLMGEDEAGTAKLVRERREQATSIVRAFGGRLVKTTGDGVLLEFPSVVAAVECAIAIQKMMAERNAAVLEAKRILYRVGVNLGDVLIDGDDILGGGVNVAARLEGICEPGAICLSASAYEQVHGRIEAEFADLGEQALKNIAKPVRVYGLTPPAIAAAKAEVPANPPAPEGVATAAATPKARVLQRWPALAAALALALIAAGGYAWRAGYAPRFMDASVDDKLAHAPRLSIVVLPFENLSSDKEQDYFADGITDDLTTDLSHIADSFVIARSTALTFKGKPVDAKTIGRELGVRHALEGSVRRVADKVTVNAQLISTETGVHVWADNFESQIGNLGQMQFEIVARLSRSLAGELIRAESLRAMRERPNNPDAVDLTFRGEATLLANFRSGKLTKSTLNDSIALFEKALSLDPQGERPMGLLGVLLGYRAAEHWSEDATRDVTRSDELIAAALALQPDDAWVHTGKGRILGFKGQWRSALQEEETAIADDRNNPEAYAAAGFFKMFLGRSAEAVTDVERAFRLSPHDFLTPLWQAQFCWLRGHLGQWDKAIEDCEKAVPMQAQGSQERATALGFLAAAYAWAGRDKEAKQTMIQLSNEYQYPNYLQSFQSLWNLQDDGTYLAELARIFEGMQKAGLPERKKNAN
jgi:adenylate cyclase